MKPYILFFLILLGSILKLMAAIPLLCATLLDEGYDAMCFDAHHVWYETRNAVVGVYKELFK